MFWNKKPPPAAPRAPRQQLGRIGPVEDVSPKRSGPLQPAGAETAMPSVISDYSQVGKFLRVLSAGERPLIAVPASRRYDIVVIEMADPKGAVILVTKNALDEQEIQQMRGALASANIAYIRYTVADEKVIRQIVEAANAAGVTKGNRRSNEYLAAVFEWVNYAVQNRATDIHLETKGTTGQVRFRIDGSVEAMRAHHQGQFSPDFISGAMSSLFNNEQQKNSGSDSLFNPEKHMYCMIPYTEIPGVTLKLRYQSLKGNEGPKAVLRLLNADATSSTLTFEQLGYAESHIKLWSQAQQTHSGTCIIAGITGSGKTTTLKSFIELNPALPSSAVITIEDPIEYPLKGTHQIHFQRDLLNMEESARMFNETMAAIMRSDLDAAMVGEIRDRDSANALVQIAESGHFAMATTHAHLLTGIVPRLSNVKMGLSRDALCAPNILTLLVYQALVPVVCQACGMTTDEVIKAGEEDISEYVEGLRQLKVETNLLRWKRPMGCSHCKERGTTGQTVVAEMLIPSSDWLTATRQSDDHKAMTIYRSDSDGDLHSANMTGKTVFEHTLHKALTGQTDVRQCNRFDVFNRFVAQNKR